MIRQLLDRDTCLKCRGCCRFPEPWSLWTPLLSRKEEKIITAACPEKNDLVADGRLATVPASGEGLHYCVLFSPEKNACSLYSLRPLECRLYPFLVNVNRDNGKAFLCVDMNCPFAAEHYGDPGFGEYVSYLADHLNSPPLLELFRREKRLLQSYPEKMPELAEIKV